MKNQNKKVGVAQKAIIFREDGKILAIRRSKTAPSRPLYWDLVGGGLDDDENPIKGILREIREETGLVVAKIKFVDVVSGFNDIGEYWVTLCFEAHVREPKVVLSYEHDNFQWVTPEEFLKIKTSPRNKRIIKRFIASQ